MDLPLTSTAFATPGSSSDNFATFTNSAITPPSFRFRVTPSACPVAELDFRKPCSGSACLKPTFGDLRSARKPVFRPELFDHPPRPQSTIFGHIITLSRGIAPLLVGNGA